MNNTFQQKIRIMRRPELIHLAGVSKNTLYTQINDGLMPPPIALSNRAVGFVEHEVNKVLAAMISGKTKCDIKKLVAELVKQRQELFEGA